MDQSINRPPYGVIVILMIGAFISFLNNTLLNVALPSIMRDLNVGPATVQWLSTGFMLASGILIPTTAFFNPKIFGSSSIFSCDWIIRNWYDFLLEWPMLFQFY